MIERAVARQIGPVREQLVSYEDKVRWRDVLGGLGYILGITGLALWLRSGRDRPLRVLAANEIASQSQIRVANTFATCLRCVCE